MAALPAGFSRRNNPDWLPTAGSSKHTLTGHRDAVNAVAFHPVYSVLVSASDDSTMKVWDWETGEMERTLKGHTKRITDCEYDSKGKNLGAFSNTAYSPNAHSFWQYRAHTISSLSCGMLRTIIKTLQLCEGMNIRSHQASSCQETTGSSAQVETRQFVSGKSPQRMSTMSPYVECIITLFLQPLYQSHSPTQRLDPMCYSQRRWQIFHYLFYGSCLVSTTFPREFHTESFLDCTCRRARFGNYEIGAAGSRQRRRSCCVCTSLVHTGNPRTTGSKGSVFILYLRAV